MSYDPKQIQERVSTYWKKHNIRANVRDSTDGNQPFFLIDGPPYLNGAPHVGHMQGKVLKDVMLRFKQMQGFDVWDQAGFDTHGLPNELKTEEELGIEDKNEIGKTISAAEFIQQCKERATSAQGLWRGVMKDLAIWQDFDNPYLTYNDDYIESEWWLVKQAAEQDLIYKDVKPIHWCPRCQTSLSGYEVTDEYQTVQDTSIFVTFPLTNRDESIVIWTTTPWTIPSNMVVFVNPDFDYARVEVDGEVLIIAEQLVDTVMAKAGYEESDYTVLNTFTGIELQGKKYELPLMENLPKQQELDKEQGVHRIQTSEDLVTLEEGTGLVHAASGHGQEDYEETQKIGIPVFSPVDTEGIYTDDAGEYAGEYVHDVNDRIVDDLQTDGALLAKQRFSHEYPHCWRCKTKLVYRAAEQWFIRNDEVKERMLEENDLVNWVPEVIGRKRFRNFVEGSPDWCISRQNYWGAPLPIWVNDETGDYVVIGSFDELAEKAGGLPDDFDPHKHVVDDITWEGEDGGTYRRVPDILDVWFDSGCAPFASVHYPFEEEPLESMWPMDFITEASDQIRGWFYSLMFCGILGFDEAPYEKILFQGHVLDSHGKKMSKSVGNVIDPQTQLDKYGADLPRFYTLRVAAPWEQTKYDEDEIEQEIYRLFSVWWNTKEFFQTYVGESDIKEPETAAMEPEDRWMISRLHSVIKQAGTKMDDCQFHEFTRDLEDFILNDVSRWYVKAVRDRIKQGDMTASWVLQEVIEKTNLLMAPFAPYISEQIYLDMDGDKPSVHMEAYPDPDETRIDRDIERGMDLAEEIVEQAVKIRDEKQYKLRWPAHKLIISADDDIRFLLDDLKPLMTTMANVEDIRFGEVATKKVAEPNYPSIGPKFGGDAETVASIIENLEHSQIEEIEEGGEIVADGYDLEEDDITVTNVTSEEVGGKPFSEGQVYLDLHMTPEITDKAFVSEVIRAIQQKRKDVDLAVEDTVDIVFDGDTEPLQEFEDMLRARINIRDIAYSGKKQTYSGTVSMKQRDVTFSFSDPVN